MIIREYQLDKLAECRRAQEECRRLHMPIPPVLSWAFEVKDRGGKIIESGIGKANSYTRNAYNIMSANVGLCSKSVVVTTGFSDGYVNTKRSNGVLSADNISRYAPKTYNADVYLGTGTTESLNDYTVPALTCNTTVMSSFDASSRKLITSLVGVYQNTSGSSKSITESGVGAYLDSSVSYPTLLIHDVFDAVVLANGSTITWTYVTEVAYPNP